MRQRAGDNAPATASPGSTTKSVSMWTTPPLPQDVQLPQKSAAARQHRCRRLSLPQRICQVCQVCLSRPASCRLLPSRYPEATPHYCRLLNKFLNKKTTIRTDCQMEMEKSRTLVVCLATVNDVLASGVLLQSNARRCT